MRRYSGGDGGDVEEAQHACLVDCARVVWAAMDTSHAPESFRGLLLRHRGRTGLTQRDFATRAGVSRNSVQDWESGLSYPTAERLQRLVRAARSLQFYPGRVLKAWLTCDHGPRAP